MKHLGPWHEDNEDRFKRGPLAAPGSYTARLISGDSVTEQQFELLMDPRVVEAGTSAQDVRQQLELELKTVDLLSRARKLEHELSIEREELEDGQKSGALSQAEKARLTIVTSALNELKTADMIYPQPMLTDQISYLYYMISSADQVPGKAAADRYQELNGLFQQMLDALGD
jgi:hypothetical protein